MSKFVSVPAQQIGENKQKSMLCCDCSAHIQVGCVHWRLAGSRYLRCRLRNVSGREGRHRSQEAPQTADRQQQIRGVPARTG
jgi:hypothetical protein